MFITIKIYSTKTSQCAAKYNAKKILKTFDKMLINNEH